MSNGFKSDIEEARDPGDFCDNTGEGTAIDAAGNVTIPMKSRSPLLDDTGLGQKTVVRNGQAQVVGEKE